MRNGAVSTEAYKLGERNYRMLRGLLKSTRTLSISSTIQARGIPEIADEQPHQVKGAVSDTLRIGERPFVSLSYLEYDEEARAQRELRAAITKTEIGSYEPDHSSVRAALSKVLETAESINMQTELGLIPTGLYCSSPFKVALDSCTILGLSYEAEPMAVPGH